MLRLALAAAAFLGTGGALAADTRDRWPFSAPVTVAADGSADLGDVEGVSGPLAEIVQAALAELPYVPATVEGVPVESTVLVDGVAALVPVGDQFEVVLEDVTTQPRLVAWRPADFPLPSLRARQGGVVTLVLRVDGNGRVTDTAVVDGTDSGLADAARTAVADWRFRPPIEGRPFEVGATFWFHGNWEAPVVPESGCTLLPAAAHLPGDDGCLRVTETTGAAVRRGGDPHVPHLVRPPAPPSAGGHPWPSR